MRKLLSGALPAPGDEPPQRDVIGAAMEWGERRRRRDWTLAGASALAVLAMGAGAAVMGGGSGGTASPGAGPKTPSPSGSSAPRGISPPIAPGTWWTPSCTKPTGEQGNLADYCRLYMEEQNFPTDFTKGSVQYLQAALPPGYTLTATNANVLILTGPAGTNFLFPSVEDPSSLDGHPLSCGTPGPNCYHTSAAGGDVVVGIGPTNAQSAGWLTDDPKDPQITIFVGTVTEGGMNGIPAPTAPALLTKEQLAKLVSDPHLRDYAKTQYQHFTDITKQLQGMASPSGSPQPGDSSNQSFSDSSGWTPPTGSTSGTSSSGSGSGSPPGTPAGATHS
ncbi:MAG: hypothetical protein ACJ786_14495 [Catenulispora sp.]